MGIFSQELSLNFPCASETTCPLVNQSRVWGTGEATVRAHIPPIQLRREPAFHLLASVLPYLLHTRACTNTSTRYSPPEALTFNVHGGQSPSPYTALHFAHLRAHVVIQIQANPDSRVTHARASGNAVPDCTGSKLKEGKWGNYITFARS